MNGRVTPVNGISLRLPAAMMNAWTPTTSVRPAASSDRKSSAADGGDPQPALDDDEVQAQDRDDADQAELLAERGQREVGVDLPGSAGLPATAAGRRRSPSPRIPPRANAYSDWTTW